MDIRLSGIICKMLLVNSLARERSPCSSVPPLKKKLEDEIGKERTYWRG